MNTKLDIMVFYDDNKKEIDKKEISSYLVECQIDYAYESFKKDEADTIIYSSSSPLTKFVTVVYMP